ncbi:helix-turn-helix domain-containing protein [Xanthobacter sp. NFH-44]|uniref:helix-turn-helix domain-containing protein n=1 Tax=unclassified Xanthobacter TaxID=2623496 RepID=UPI00351D28D7
MIEKLLIRHIGSVNRNSINEAPVISVRQVKAARAMLAWSQGDLAKASGVSEPTIARLESVDGPLGGRADTVSKIVAALEAAGVLFIEQNGNGPGVRLRGRA